MAMPALDARAIDKGRYARGRIVLSQREDSDVVIRLSTSRGRDKGRKKKRAWKHAVGTPVGLFEGEDGDILLAGFDGFVDAVA